MTLNGLKLEIEENIIIFRKISLLLDTNTMQKFQVEQKLWQIELGLLEFHRIMKVSRPII